MFRRRKGLFTILFVLSCFLYINWLVKISDWKQNDKISSSENIDSNFKRDNKISIFELFEVYDQDESIKYNGHFVLMSPKNTSDSKENFLKKIFTNTDKLDKDEFSSIINLLFLNKAFLLDKTIFQKIIFNDVHHTSNLLKDQIYNITTFDKIKTFIMNEEFNQNTILITYGIYLENFLDLNEALINNLNKKCNLIQMSNSYSNLDILTSLYIECLGMTIQISIVYERGSFLWIASDDYQIKFNKKIFGDKPRAINRFELVEVVDENSRSFYMPSNIEKFLFEYGHSVFLECNRDLAKRNLKKLGFKHAQDHKKNKMISPVIEHISKTLERFKKHYWLAGGTLLGWYRDCGIIPFTQDVDIAIWASEYDEIIKKHFLGNKIVRVWGTLGLVNDSYEFRLFNDRFTFDMFLVYKINQTHQWCGYQVKRYKFRRFLPNFDNLCSAELLNNKYMVPCDPEKYLNKEYGAGRWQTPESKNYTWSNVIFWKNWTDSEWPHTIKYYDKNGNLLSNKILEYVNKYLDQNISQVPADDF